MQEGSADWLFYDGSCGVCCKWAAYFKAALSKKGIEISPLQSELAQELFQMADEELLKEVRLVLNEGVRLSGPDVYRYLFRRTIWLYPVYLLSIVPPFSRLFNFSCRMFANHRNQISRICRIK